MPYEASFFDAMSAVSDQGPAPAPVHRGSPVFLAPGPGSPAPVSILCSPGPGPRPRFNCMKTGDFFGRGF